MKPRLLDRSMDPCLQLSLLDDRDAERLNALMLIPEEDLPPFDLDEWNGVGNLPEDERGQRFADWVATRAKKKTVGLSTLLRPQEAPDHIIGLLSEVLKGLADDLRLLNIEIGNNQRYIDEWSGNMLLPGESLEEATTRLKREIERRPDPTMMSDPDAAIAESRVEERRVRGLLAAQIDLVERQKDIEVCYQRAWRVQEYVRFHVSQALRRALLTEVDSVDHGSRKSRARPELHERVLLTSEYVRRMSRAESGAERFKQVEMFLWIGTREGRKKKREDVRDSDMLHQDISIGVSAYRRYTSTEKKSIRRVRDALREHLRLAGIGPLPGDDLTGWQGVVEDPRFHNIPQ